MCHYTKLYTAIIFDAHTKKNGLCMCVYFPKPDSMETRARARRGKHIRFKLNMYSDLHSYTKAHKTEIILRVLIISQAINLMFFIYDMKLCVRPCTMCMQTLERISKREIDGNRIITTTTQKNNNIGKKIHTWLNAFNRCYRKIVEESYVYPFIKREQQPQHSTLHILATRGWNTEPLLFVKQNNAYIHTQSERDTNTMNPLIMKEWKKEEKKHTTFKLYILRDKSAARS